MERREKEAEMARMTVYTSSISGVVIPPNTGARVRIKHDGKLFVADLTDAEVGEFVKSLKAEERKPRASKKSKAAAAAAKIVKPTPVAPVKAEPKAEEAKAEAPVKKTA
jgi:hypothetical protein